ncbi:PHP domain-containing protein [Dactylosporangium fulvum]|uniref:PHP domain-containing protein n=1 Tax=Dactylosporangium fulvum TaxID=53359 RepID=A0ABY5W0U2_9ACTN|nr:PHP domain-containing protein [Dactylosporangium fulvum]UWP82318.1 PHP domain-containing protein [Dactylosporangium fulvum]
MPTARDPLADLRRIAFLLERAHEKTYRVRAFRGAAAALAKLPEGEIATRAAAGKLTELAGVGDVTARCVVESLNGEEPVYLRRLESTAGQDLDAETAALRAALRGDCHAHSDWSDGGSPIDEMALAAAELGHEYLVLTDHSPRLTVARGLSAERLAEQLDVVTEINAGFEGLGMSFRILTGIEVDILADGSLDQTDELLARLDVVVGSVHSNLKDESAVMTERMVTALANPHLDILGHCTGRLITGGRGTRDESQFDPADVFAAAVEHDKAIEINSRPERLDPPKRLLRVALEMGCRFSIDTDAHAPGQLDWLPNGCARAVACGVPADRIVNTMPAAGLLAWTAAHD